MIKIVFSEVESPTTAEEASDLNFSSAVRAINTSKTPSTIYIKDPTFGPAKSITLVGGESLILKKHSKEVVYASSKHVRIAGVSIY